MIALDRKLESPETDRFKQGEVDFAVQVLRFGAQFAGWVYAGDDAARIKQQVKAGNATFQYGGDGLSVRTQVGGALLAAARVSRRDSEGGRWAVCEASSVVWKGEVEGGKLKKMRDGGWMLGSARGGGAEQGAETGSGGRRAPGMKAWVLPSRLANTVWWPACATRKRSGGSVGSAPLRAAGGERAGGHARRRRRCSPRRGTRCCP